MTDFNDRQKGEEAKYAFDEENAFTIAARRNRLVGHWAAELMGLDEEETKAYATAVVQADFEEAGDEDVIRKLLGDLTTAAQAAQLPTFGTPALALAAISPPPTTVICTTSI